MENDYLKYPATVKSLAEEIKIACNDYYSRKIDNETIKKIILWYATNQPDKLFYADDFNPTVKKIIGKKRIKLISDLLPKFNKTDGGVLNG